MFNPQQLQWSFQMCDCAASVAYIVNTCKLITFTMCFIKAIQYRILYA